MEYYDKHGVKFLGKIVNDISEERYEDFWSNEYNSYLDEEKKKFRLFVNNIRKIKRILTNFNIRKEQIKNKVRTYNINNNIISEIIIELINHNQIINFLMSLFPYLKKEQFNSLDSILNNLELRSFIYNYPWTSIGFNRMIETILKKAYQKINDERKESLIRNYTLNTILHFLTDKEMIEILTELKEMLFVGNFVIGPLGITKIYSRGYERGSIEAPYYFHSFYSEFIFANINPDQKEIIFSMLKNKVKDALIAAQNNNSFIPIFNNFWEKAWMSVKNNRAGEVQLILTFLSPICFVEVISKLISEGRIELNITNQIYKNLVLTKYGFCFKEADNIKSSIRFIIRTFPELNPKFIGIITHDMSDNEKYNLLFKHVVKNGYGELFDFYFNPRYKRDFLKQNKNLALDGAPDNEVTEIFLLVFSLKDFNLKEEEINKFIRNLEEAEKELIRENNIDFIDKFHSKIYVPLEHLLNNSLTFYSKHFFYGAKYLFKVIVIDENRGLDYSENNVPPEIEETIHKMNKGRLNVGHAWGTLKDLNRFLTNNTILSDGFRETFGKDRLYDEPDGIRNVNRFNNDLDVVLGSGNNFKHEKLVIRPREDSFQEAKECIGKIKRYILPLLDQIIPKTVFVNEKSDKGFMLYGVLDEKNNTYKIITNNELDFGKKYALVARENDTILIEPFIVELNEKIVAGLRQ